MQALKFSGKMPCTQKSGLWARVVIRPWVLCQITLVTMALLPKTDTWMKAQALLKLYGTVNKLVEEPQKSTLSCCRIKLFSLPFAVFKDQHSGTSAALRRG